MGETRIGELTYSWTFRGLSERFGNLDGGIWAGKVQQERGREVGAGRVTTENNLALGDAQRVDQVVVARERLDELRRVFVLGREAVVEEEDGRGDAMFFLE